MASAKSPRSQLARGKEQEYKKEAVAKKTVCKVIKTNREIFGGNGKKKKRKTREGQRDAAP
jgi:hypothetical protein